MSDTLTSLDVIFPGPRQVELLHNQVPRPGPGEVRCTARKSLVSRGTETFCLKGEYDKGTYWEEYIRYPFAPGYSMSSIIDAVGDGVTAFKRGDRVASWHPHRQYFVVPQGEVFAIPDGITDEEATWATLSRTTQLGVRRAELELGETAIVIGLGILGQLVIQYLAIGGARRIIAVDTSPRRGELARAGGATDVVLKPAGEAREDIVRITGGKMADVVFDITGHPAVLAPATLLLRKLGRLVLLGDSPTPSLQHLGPRVVGDSLAILGQHGFLFPHEATPFNQWTAAEMTGVFFDFVQQRRMNVAPLIDRLESPHDAARVYDDLLTGRDDAIGIVFDWTKLAA